MSAEGTIFLSGGRMDVYISANRGGSWRVSPSLTSLASAANAGWPLLATTLTGTFGVVIQQGTGAGQVWLTSDDGGTWTSATVR